LGTGAKRPVRTLYKENGMKTRRGGGGKSSNHADQLGDPTGRAEGKKKCIRFRTRFGQGKASENAGGTKPG